MRESATRCSARFRDTGRNWCLNSGFGRVVRVVSVRPTLWGPEAFLVCEAGIPLLPRLPVAPTFAAALRDGLLEE